MEAITFPIRQKIEVNDGIIADLTTNNEEQDEIIEECRTRLAEAEQKKRENEGEIARLKTKNEAFQTQMTQIIAMFQQMTQMVAAVVSADDSVSPPSTATVSSAHTNKAVSSAKSVSVSAPAPAVAAPAPAPPVEETTVDAAAEEEVAEDEEVI
jgi:chromosome condensin MukBEF ATPase and DNA-binding subunit MukB